MTQHPMYRPLYSTSHALVIGVNRYKHVGPLAFAVNDANAIAKILQDKFDFPKEKITLLTDENASRAEITASFMKFADTTRVNPDDRLLVFYAGHGHTAQGRRGETGFLVPADGRVDDLSTLVRWDEFTRGSDLIPAKHIFFMMDACYGGLALTRKTVPPGSMRLLNDMMQRFTRQVLTAGKADETVSDGGGVRPGHSIFTAHVLEALEGAASATEGVITANGVMSYVYQQVGSDQHSKQTPHYGFLDGDGDFVFEPVPKSEGSPIEKSILVQTMNPTPLEPTEPEQFADRLKRLLSDPSQGIALDDFVTAHLRKTIQDLSLEKFPVQGPTNGSFSDRVKAYDEALGDIEIAVILLARWATPSQLKLLEKIFSRLASADKGQAGSVLWLRLGWYPILRLMYAAGISALSEGRYDALATTFNAPVVVDPNYSARIEPLLAVAMPPNMEVVEYFKQLPGMDRRYTPRSDYLFNSLQAVLEDQLFLGSTYEPIFDEYELILALAYADLRAGDQIGRAWGPPGRFAWKHHSRGDHSPLQAFATRIEREGADWGPLKFGFFRGSKDRLVQLLQNYEVELNQLGWW